MQERELEEGENRAAARRPQSDLTGKEKLGRVVRTIRPLLKEILMTYYTRRASSSFFCLCVLGILLLCTSASARAGLIAIFESPADGEKVAGVTLIHGWAFDTEANVQISSVTLFVDDLPPLNVACCTTRLDVQAAFPSSANARNSGFGLTVNWGGLSADRPHTIRLEVRTTAGGVFVSDTRNITVIKPGNFVFLDQFNPNFNESVAVVEEDGALCIDTVEIRDKISGNTKVVKLKYRWQEACQCLTLISSEEGEEAFCDF